MNLVHVAEQVHAVFPSSCQGVTVCSPVVLSLNSCLHVAERRRIDTFPYGDVSVDTPAVLLLDSLLHVADRSNMIFWVPVGTNQYVCLLCYV